MMKNDYPSHFVANLSIDISAYITELIILNKLYDRLERKTKNAINIPKCAFWRKEMFDKHPEFEKLAKDFYIEIAYTRRLLNCFLPKVVIQYVKKNRCITFTYKKMADQRQMVFDLFKDQNAMITELRKAKKEEEKLQKHKAKLNTKVSNRQSMNTKLSLWE